MWEVCFERKNKFHFILTNNEIYFLKCLSPLIFSLIFLLLFHPLSIFGFNIIEEYCNFDLSKKYNIQPVCSSCERSKSISLDDSGIPLSIVNVRRASPNFCNLSGYLLPPTRLPPIARSQLLARAIISLYYL